MAHSIKKVQRITDTQIFMIEELAAQLNKDVGDCTDLTFEQAHELKEKLEDEVREMCRTRGHIWTEGEVWSRLRNYTEDDALYYAKVSQPKPVLTYGFNTGSDSRIIKKADLDRGIEGSLRPFGHRRPVTKKHKHKERLYYLIKLIYVYGSGFNEAAKILNTPKRNLYNLVGEAVSLITGFLNGSNVSTDNDSED